MTTSRHLEISGEPIRIKDYETSNNVVDPVINRAVDIQAQESDSFPPPVLFTETELQLLYETAVGIHDSQPTKGNIIQLGTYRGGGAAVLGLAVKHRGMGELAVTVDSFQYLPHEVHKHGNLTASTSLFESFSLQRHIASVWHDDLCYIHNFLNCPVRMVVLDSTHSYKHVSQQLEMIETRIISGGWVLIHDYTLNPRYEGVVRAVNEWHSRQNSSCRLFRLERWACVRMARK